MTAGRIKLRLAQDRTFSPEAEKLLKQRLELYKRRSRRPSMEDVAADLSSWSGIEQWFPKAFSVRSKPTFTRRILDTWKSGDTSHADRRLTKPKGSRLTVIAEFLIDKKCLFEFELNPDDVGFGLTNALQAYLKNPSVSDAFPIEGSYQAYTDDDVSLILHRLNVFVDIVENVLMFEYTSVQAYARYGDTPTKLQEKIATNANFLYKNSIKGWGVRSDRNKAIAFLSRHSEAPIKREVWIWSFDQIFGTCFVTLLHGENSPSKSPGDEYEDRGHRQPTMKRLTYGNDISYHLLRRGGRDMSIIRNIMEKQNKTELSQLDEDFLRAAHQGDPDWMLETLAKGADINAIDPATGLTALNDAAAGAVSGIIEILIKQPNLNPSIPNKYGRMASEVVAFTVGDFDLVERLIDVEVTYEELHPPQP